MGVLQTKVLQPVDQARSTFQMFTTLLDTTAHLVDARILISKIFENPDHSAQKGPDFFSSPFYSSSLMMTVSSAIFAACSGRVVSSAFRQLVQERFRLVV